MLILCGFHFLVQNFSGQKWTASFFEKFTHLAAILDLVWAGPANKWHFCPYPTSYIFSCFTPRFLFSPICSLHGKYGWNLFSCLWEIAGKNKKRKNKIGNNISRVAPLCDSAWLKKLLPIFRSSWQINLFSFQKLITDGGKHHLPPNTISRFRLDIRPLTRDCRHRLAWRL